MSIQGKNSKLLYQKAKEVIPYGVNSNFRYWGEDEGIIINKGQGTYIWDVDDKKYIDYRLGFGPIILGHSYHKVVEQVSEVIKNGTVFALTTPLEIEVAERIIRMTGVEKVRLANTGTESTMHAIRMARAYTDREKIIKFEGNYHGMHDYLLFNTASTNIKSLGSKRSINNIPASSGIPKGISEYLITLPYNNFERLEETINARWHEVAAVIVEPTMGNVAGITPLPGWLEKIRELCTKYGIILIFDEVKTGFRIANGGAQEYFGIKADLVTYAKSLGNGFPIAAIGGKEEIMMVVEPGLVSHGGTYTGNAVGTAAAKATLDVLETEPVIETINKKGNRLMQGVAEIFSQHNVPHCITGVPPMFGYFVGTDQQPHDLRDYNKGDAVLYEKLSLGMIERGVFPEADGREPWFLCYELSDNDVDFTLNAFEDSLKDALS